VSDEASEPPHAPAVAPPAVAPAPGRLGRVLKHLFFWLVVKPLVAVVLGLNVRHRERLPAGGPAVLVANHNSHLDTLVLMSLLPARLLPRVRPVAAADYFLANRPLAWFSLHVLGVLPVVRGGRRADPSYDPLAHCRQVLDRGEVVVIFPEGTRGEAERMARLKSGIGHLALSRPEVPVVPCYLHGLGKTLPKGTRLPVPFFCDVFVGEATYGGDPRWRDDPKAWVEELAARIEALAAEGSFAAWE
jgi:1-acyl-sn-glycerol-3-phosphate acyltransferase